MVTDADFEDLKESFDRYRKVVDTLLVNLLQPALDVPGTLRYGGNVMQLDQNGAQVVAPVASPATTAIFFVPRFSAEPATVYPRGEMDGYAVSSANQAVAQLVAYRSASVYSMLQTWTGAASNPQTAMYAVDATTTGSAILSMTSGVGIFALSGAYLELFQQAADPASPVDGDIWYNQTSHQLKARINGSTVTLGGTLTTLLLTDTAWAAKGDLVVGTANDTASILSKGDDGKVLTANSATATGLEWQTPAAGSFSYGKAITTSQGQNLP